MLNTGLDLAQTALAPPVGCAEVTIRKLEAEVARPSRQIIQRLAVCLEIPLQTPGLPETDTERVLCAEDALVRLIDLELLETDAAGSLRMHRLVMAFVRAVLGSIAALVDVTILRVADEVNDLGIPTPCWWSSPISASSPRS